MKVYEVKALDKIDGKVVTFNHNLTKTLDDAIAFAKHLHEDCSDGYTDISLTITEYEYIRTDVYPINNFTDYKKVGK